MLRCAAAVPRVMLLVMGLTAQAEAQGSAPVSSKSQYIVRGIFEGTELEPWQSQLSVADSTLLGVPAYRALHESRRVGSEFLYKYTATWRRQGAGRNRHVLVE